MTFDRVIFWSGVWNVGLGIILVTPPVREFLGLQIPNPFWPSIVAAFLWYTAATLIIRRLHRAQRTNAEAGLDVSDGPGAAMRCSVVICWTRSLLLYAQFPAHAHGGADRLQGSPEHSRVEPNSGFRFGNDAGCDTG